MIEVRAVISEAVTPFSYDAIRGLFIRRGDCFLLMGQPRNEDNGVYEASRGHWQKVEVAEDEEVRTMDAVPRTYVRMGDVWTAKHHDRYPAINPFDLIYTHDLAELMGLYNPVNFRTVTTPLLVDIERAMHRNADHPYGFSDIDG